MRRDIGVRFYILVTAVVALAVLVASWRELPPRDAITVAVLCLLGYLSERQVVRLFSQRVTLSTTAIVQLATAAIAGPAAAMVVGIAAALALLSRPRRNWLFNAGLYAVGGASAGTAYLLAGGVVGADGLSVPAEVLSRVVLPLSIANAAIWLVNSVVLSGVVAVDRDERYLAVLTGTLVGSGVYYIGYGFFGVLLAVLWDAGGVGPLSALLVLAPLVVARWTYAQYAEERVAHQRVVATLVQAVEAKDHYTRGHSERVAHGARLIGRTLRLSDHRTEMLHFAGMLHDVGKIGVPTRVLQKTAPLTDVEYRELARHPVQGVRVVRDIGFLKEAYEGILHHHERMDGRGYPLGLAGKAIPEFARIIAVVDAFDSMTSTRAYRRARTLPEALAELADCAGSQFDPQYVAAFREALRKASWPPAHLVSDPDDMASTSDMAADAANQPTAADHDDPHFEEHRRSVMAGMRSVGPVAPRERSEQ
ncbi:MAG: HD-GYP domain-containing protein [Angustibacter sp.]